jgi:hypothetical protein
VDETTGETLGTADLDENGAASLTTAALSAGTHTITASYAGNADFAASSGSTTQVVNLVATATALASAPNPSTFGEDVTFTATVTAATGTPAGTVTFVDETTGETLGTADLDENGVASLTTAALSAGTHTITATYAGNGTFSASSDSVAQAVDRVATAATLDAAPNPSTFGEEVTFTATVTSDRGTPAGSVTFVDETTGDTLGTADLDENGVASLTTAALSGGTHVVTASYAGDANFAPSSGSVTQTVNSAATATTLESSPNPSMFAEEVTFTVTVTSAAGTPGGTVTFVDETTGNTLGTVDLDENGAASITTAALSAGTHTVTATYAGSADFVPSSGSTTQTVEQAVTATTLESALNPSMFGEAVTFIAKVTSAAGTPAGSVTFVDETTGDTLGTADLDESGTASITTAALSTGTHTITATYAGSANLAPSSGSVAQTVNPAATVAALVASPNPSTFGEEVTFTVTVTSAAGTPSGTVKFVDETTGETLGAVDLDEHGVASLTTAALPAGTHTVTATYAGNESFAASSGSTTQTVEQAVTATTLESSPNPATFGDEVTFTATVTSAAGTPSGTVTFVDDTTGETLGMAELDENGVASLTTAALSAGTHTVTATYSGSANFATSIGMVDQIVVEPA